MTVEVTDTVEEIELDPIIALMVKEREARDWTQTEVARRLGHTTSSGLWTWEKGQVVPGLANLRAWAALFDIEIVARPRITRGRPRTNFKNN